MERLKAAWAKMGIAPGSVVVNFIAVVPRYAWSVRKPNKMEVGVEKKVGYRMQTNIHLAVQKDSTGARRRWRHGLRGSGRILLLSTTGAGTWTGSKSRPANKPSKRPAVRPTPFSPPFSTDRPADHQRAGTDHGPLS